MGFGQMNPQMQARIQQAMRSPQFQQKYQQNLRNMNPAQVLDQIQNNEQAMNIPIVQSVMNARNNGDIEGLTGIAQNVFKNKGQDYSAFEKEMKQFLGNQ